MITRRPMKFNLFLLLSVIFSLMAQGDVEYFDEVRSRKKKKFCRVVTNTLHVCNELTVGGVSLPILGYGYITKTAANTAEIGIDSDVVFDGLSFPAVNVIPLAEGLRIVNPGTYFYFYTVRGTPIGTDTPLQFELRANGVALPNFNSNYASDDQAPGDSVSRALSAAGIVIISQTNTLLSLHNLTNEVGVGEPIDVTPPVGNSNNASLLVIRIS